MPSREALLYAFQALLVVAGLRRLRTVQWPNKTLWGAFLGFVGIGDAAYWFFSFSPWASTKTPYLYFFTGMIWYLAGTAAGIAFLFLSASPRRARDVRAALLDVLPALLILAISCKFVLNPMARKVLADGVDVRLLSAASYFAVSVAAIIVCLRTLLVEEDRRLMACAAALLTQSLAAWAINTEHLVSGTSPFTWFDVIWFFSVFFSVLPAFRWPAAAPPAAEPRTGEEMSYQVRYWLLLLVLLPLTLLSFLQAFDSNAISLVSLAILAGVGFVLVASEVLLRRIRSSAELKTFSATALLASQVAHDIRSPLAALEVLLRSEGLPEAERDLMRSTVERMRGIADGLLSTNRRALARTREFGLQHDAFTPSDEAARDTALRDVVASVVAEKRLEYRDRSGIVFREAVAPDAGASSAKVQPTELRRLLSNLINNAAESLARETGTVGVALAVRDGGPVIEISDDGKGIAPGELKALGELGRSVGKPGGSGMGLFHATRTMRRWGGRLDVRSEAGAGTTVTLTFRG